jgi:hypothetical protein
MSREIVATGSDDAFMEWCMLYGLSMVHWCLLILLCDP